MIFEDDETLQMYVEESLEHLSDIENDLLAVEEDGANINEELVNNVFRAAHSIKGGAGFMGLTTIKNIAHNLENILGLVRSRELVPTPDIISVLLRSFDKLRELITNIETSNETDVTEYINELLKVTTESLPEDEKDSVSQNFIIRHPASKAEIETSKFDMDQAEKEGKYVYLVEYDLINDIHKKNKTPLDVMTSLLNSGTVINAIIDVHAVGELSEDLPPRIPFVILFASIIEPDMAPILVDLPEEYVHTITSEIFQSCQPVGSEVKAEVQAPETSPEVNIPAPEPAPEPVAAPEPAAIETIVEEPVVVAEPEQVVVPAATPVFAETEPAGLSDGAKTDAPKGVPTQASLRVNVNLLDTLMTLAGELVLSRNQLIQGITGTNAHAIEASSQRIDMITSELQEAIMRTRMQPISNVFNKFSRVVRDLSRDLGKKIQLDLEGKEVELDKTIIEAINDPLTHLVRNSVDHGIETPEMRINKGKSELGHVKLKAFHEAGQVNIEIEDDGKGLNGEELGASAIKKGLISEQEVAAMSMKEKIGLIFLPGFSTAKEITDVSGRGVGMDVVKTNLDKLGGIVDIDSKVGHGTVIRIKLPLTLAIIPSQIISVGKERFAIPQVNLSELLRIPASQVKDRIEKVGDAEVVRLRGTLLPLMNLSQVLGIKKTFIHPVTGEETEDRRLQTADRRSKQSIPGEDVVDNGSEAETNRSAEDRRFHADSAINIAVVSAGNFKYGMVVDHLRDSEEIVVKPLGRHLKDCEGYAGATIMGDGKVALILDVASLAKMAHLSSSASATSTMNQEKALREEELAKQDKAALLLFRNTPEEQFAAPLNLVERIERISTKEIEVAGGKKVIQYRGGTLPLYELSQVANVPVLPERDQLEVVVFRLLGREVGLMVTPPVDAIEVSLNVDESTLRQPGVIGSTIINDRTTLMVDIFDIVKSINPEMFEEQDAANKKAADRGQKKVLFAEDSAFFRNQVKGFIEEDGYEVLVAEDGLIAWNLLEEVVGEVGIILTDLEMPNMDGFEFTSRVKNDDRFNHLKVVALTSLAGEEDIARGKAVGIDDYQIKLDRENLMRVIRQYILS